MNMSSVCPGGRSPGQPGEYVGEYRGIDSILCSWGGKNSRHCFKVEGNRTRTVTTGIYIMGMNRKRVL